VYGIGCVGVVCVWVRLYAVWSWVRLYGVVCVYAVSVRLYDLYMLCMGWDCNYMTCRLMNIGRV
jgi:hypothetical protein